VDLSIPIIQTENEHETAAFLARIAIREQIDQKRQIQIKGKRKAITIGEQQELVAAALPDINLTLGRRLLEHFGTLKAIFCAEEVELSEVKGIGKVTASKLKNLFTEKYLGK
jgi:Fanconi anemia group M protein